MELVKRTIQRYVQPSEFEWAAILAPWRELAYSKGASICAVGQVEERFYIVERGVQRLSFPHDGQDICVGFSYNGSWSGDYASFVTRQPARFDVMAITDSVLVGIAHSDLQRLYTCLLYTSRCV